MRLSTPPSRLLIIGLTLFLLCSEILSAVLRAHGRSETGLFVLFRTMGWVAWLGWWYETDARQRGDTPVLDMGLLLAIAWPFVMFQRLIALGPKQALRTILLAIGIFLVAKLAGFTVYALLTT